MNRVANFFNGIIATLRVFFPSCRQASRLQSDALDRPLPFLQRWGLALHLRMCKWCRRYGRQIAFLRTVAHKCDQEERPLSEATLRPEVRERIKQALKNNTDSNSR